MSAKPTKAYYVEKIQLTFTDYLVYAKSAADAKARVRAGEGQGVNSETYGTGKLGKVRRVPEEDEV